MRSRYSAYVMQAMHYLEATHDPATRKDFDVEQAASWAKRASWQSLELSKVEGGADSDSAFVEFIARYTLEGQAQAHHERSRFRRHEGRWFYVDGATPAAKRGARVGRNERCPCGSGKKYKRCCGSS